MIQRANICVDSRFMGTSGTSTSTITQPANLTASVVSDSVPANQMPRIPAAKLID
jgi:hypothetical protein